MLEERTFTEPCLSSKLLNCSSRLQGRKVMVTWVHLIIKLWESVVWTELPSWTWSHHLGPEPNGELGPEPNEFLKGMWNNKEQRRILKDSMFLICCCCCGKVLCPPQHSLKQTSIRKPKEQNGKQAIINQGKHEKVTGQQYPNIDGKQDNWVRACDQPPYINCKSA